ncbi:MAG: nitrous oxide-stimulated promoter family protein [Thermogutta sp.]
MGLTDGMAYFPLNGRRIRRERATISAMIRIYCQKNHASAKNLCEDCQALLDYSLCRLDRCIFGEEKPTCVHCPVHCYKPAMRERVRAVMRFSGPWMMFYHPILTVLHFWDGRKKAPGDHPLARKLSQ